jgi:hypothetical protein
MVSFDFQLLLIHSQCLFPVVLGVIACTAKGFQLCEGLQCVCVYRVYSHTLCSSAGE